MNRLVFALMALPVGAFAQARPCIDMTGDWVVDISDVTLIYRIAAGLEPGEDPRGDVDLDGHIDISDAVNAFLVASGQRFAVSLIDPPAPADGEAVAVSVVGLPERAVVDVVIRADGQEVLVPGVRAAGAGAVRGVATLEFAFPDLAGICPGGGCRNVTLGVRMIDRLSNFCPLAPLLPGERDGDRDGVPDQRDFCPQHRDPINADIDEDGVGDLCDNCPIDVNPGQEDGNADGSGDGCEAPRVVHLGGRVIEPEPGIDARLDDPEVKHAVLVLTREANEEILALLERSNIHVIEPLAGNVFMVGLNQCGMRICPGFADLQRFPWFFAAFPLSPEDRLEAGLNVEQPPEPFELDVEFHGDVSVAEAEVLLRELGAGIIARGVEIGLPDGGVQRVNVWRIGGNADVLRRLAELDAVAWVEFKREPTPFNENSRAVVGVDAVNQSGNGLMGSDIRVMLVDLGWPDGDDTAPPAPLANPHPALAGAVTIRDCPTCEGNIPYPLNCNANDNEGIFANGSGYSQHTTHVAGTIIGDGGVNAGMAPAATIIAYAYGGTAGQRICERHDAMQNFRTQVNNNSWGHQGNSACNFLGGPGISANYVLQSRAYDVDIRLFPYATEVFAAGNNQNLRNTYMGPLSCDLPATYGACTAPPPGVPAPPAIQPPIVDIAKRFFTVVAPGATAKSTLTVGAVDYADGHRRMTNFSGWGPTLDGRIKPEVVAPGYNIRSVCVPTPMQPCDNNGYHVESGTSSAAAVASGAAALVTRRFRQLGFLVTRADTMRALLAHTATDLGVHPGGGAFLNHANGPWPAFGPADGPDFVTGYGLLNADAARLKVNRRNIAAPPGQIAATLKPAGCPTGVPYNRIPFESPTNIGGPGPVAGCPPVGNVVWYVSVPVDKTHFKVTIAWNDPASPNDSPGVINDLNLMLRSPAGRYYHPWRLDPACPYLPAVRQGNLPQNLPAYAYADHRNTLEQVDIIGPTDGQEGIARGEWRIIVTASGLGQRPQPFSMMVDLD